MIKKFENLIFGASRRLNYISGFALVMMMCLVFFNVVARTFWRPLLGTYEYTAFLASLTIAFSLAYCAMENGHVAITLFTDSFPRWAKTACDLLVGTIGTLLFAVLSWQSLVYAIGIYRVGEVAPTTETPFYPFIIGIAFGFLMIAAVNLIDLLNSLKKVVKR